VARQHAPAEAVIEMIRKPYTGVRAPSPFVLLDEQHKRDAILRLVDSRVGDHTIAAACGLAVATVRRVIAERDVR
jgi:hypothetical protein